MRVTIRKIAEAAGVSRGTVDRVLNNRAGVNQEVREKILRIASELNYVPNAAGKALALSKKPMTFGVIMPPEDIAFFDEIKNGIHAAWEEMKDLGIQLEYRYVSNREPKEAVEAIKTFVAQGVLGIMFSGMDAPAIRKAIDDAVERNIPVITFNSDIGECKRLCFVGQDLYKSGRIAAVLMCKVVEKGSKIIVVTGSMKFQAHKERVDGFIDRIRDLNNPLSIVRVIESFDSYEETYDRVSDSLRSMGVQGIYMATGHVGACLDAVKEYGMGNKIHIICNDLLDEVIIGLKSGMIDFTITQNPFMQGYKPLKLLYEYAFHGKKPEQEYFYTENNIKLFENIDR